MARDEYRVHSDIKNKYKELLDGNGKLIVNVSQDIARQTSGRYGVTTSQIRRVFGDLKRMQYKDFNQDKIQLIRPKLAYTFSRHSNKQGLDLLLGTIDFLIDNVSDKNEFYNLVSFFEAILAYHKKFGGK